MQDFDEFAVILFEEATRFLEKSKITTKPKEIEAYLHASILVGMSALEAFVNAIAEEMLLNQELSLLERSLLAEKVVEFNNGKYKLGTQLKIHRIIERIEFLYCKFSGKAILSSDTWFFEIKQSIQLRNNLVHPKAQITINKNQTKKLLESILETINALYLAIYKRELPILRKGLQSELTF